MPNSPGQKFFHDSKNDVYYLVNFQEKRYMKIAEKGSQYYELCRHLYCQNWNLGEELDKIITTFKKVDRLPQIDGSEE